MSAKNYRDYIELLRSREARPSFEQTKANLASRESESSAYFAGGSQIRNLTVGIVSLVFLALITRTVLESSPKEVIAVRSAQQAMTSNVNNYTLTPREHYPSGTSLRGVTKGFIAATNDFGHTPTNSSTDLSASEGSLPDTLAGSVTSVPARPVKIECVLQKVIPLTLSQTANYEVINTPSNHFFLTLNGSLSQEMSSSAAFNSLSAGNIFFGGGYIISSRLSVGLIGGIETFVMRQPNDSISFSDSQFVHDGNVYPSIIGHIDTISARQTTQVYSIGANLRYTFGENHSSPYAEIFGGGSTEGAIAGATIGANIFINDQLSLDAGAFFRALIPTAGSPLTKFGANVGLRYDW